ncbi:hypothetical protein SAMN06295974_2079 [Plantibacter flavus]|uniref:DUF4352 domain-containing protein n=1 Tax=Plantibacter flavus TaxID=150123 RepID=A0A3N2BZQ7_9MICO|nr:hypothetical protein [Plantibacter flavus]ROR80756.1 hypothetical protein EDD42_0799 [Plantibacter flavus]SMG31479.1 hypothetical protein SAMN06295974_2079 [Plantibacter flavus]
MAEAEERPETAAPSGETGAPGRRRVTSVVISVVVALVVIGVVLWLTIRPGTPAGDGTTEPSSTPASSSSADPTRDPDATLPPAGSGTGSIGFDDTADVTDAVSLKIESLEAVTGEASQPGEVAGPSVRVTIAFTNSGNEAYSLAGAVANAYYGADLTPAIELAAPGGVRFPEQVAAGETVRGTFIFNIPEDARDAVRITVDYAAAEPAVVFEGAAPR